MAGVSSHPSLTTVNNSNNLSILYYNARSILPKHDELRLIVEVNNPDIICIVETWLSSEILDSEVALPGYQVHRLDRNRHGGGIPVYVRDSFVSNLLSSPDNLELLTLSIANDINKVCLSLFIGLLIYLLMFFKIYFCICSLLTLVSFLIIFC